MVKGAVAAIVGASALVAVVGLSSAATSSPSAGVWTGQLTHVKPTTAIEFNVVAKGRKRTVALFASAREFKTPCSGNAAITGIGAIPTATVGHGGKFKAVGADNNGLGIETWTVSGQFKSSRAASGTVAIDLATGPTTSCKFKVSWTAREQVAKPPQHGATYRGKSLAFPEPVVLKVSANGKKLSSVTWTAPVIGGTCPGIGLTSPTFHEHNVPIHGSTFSDTVRSGKLTHGSGTVATNTITGQFFAGRTASGSVSTSTFITGFGNVCKGNETWTAHS